MKILGEKIEQPESNHKGTFQALGETVFCIHEAFLLLAAERVSLQSPCAPMLPWQPSALRQNPWY